MPSLVKARSGVLNSNVGGNALAPLFSTGSLTTANLITDVTRLAGVQGDGAAYPDSSVGVWPAATNIGTNGGLETNTTGWGVYGTGASFARVTTTSKFGSACGKVTSAGAGNVKAGSGGTNSITGAPVSQVTRSFSLWVKGEGATIGKTVSWQVNESGGAFGDANMGGVAAASSTLTSSWQRLTVTGSVTRADRTSLYAFATVTADGAGEVFYVDGYQPELGLPTPYIETDGGTASRSAGTITMPASVLDETQMWVAFRVRMGFGSSAKPGSDMVLLDWRDDANNRVTLEYSAGNAWDLIRVGGGVGTSAPFGDTVAIGDEVTVIGVLLSGGHRLSANGAAFSALQITSGIPALSASSLYLGSAGPLGAAFYGDLLWAAAGLGTLTDADAALFNSWGNNDPLPHTFPKSAQLSFLAHFNGDGTFYRRSA